MSDMNKTYINILIDTLRKKTNILAGLTEQTKKQEGLLLSSELDPDKFDETITAKQQLLEKLDQIDQGFEDIYARVRSELAQHKEEYKEEIIIAQDLIRKITEQGMDLTALENRNKSKMTLKLAENRQKIKDFKISSKTAAAYYKNMSNKHQEGQSYFMDSKQ